MNKLKGFILWNRKESKPDTESQQENITTTAVSINEPEPLNNTIPESGHLSLIDIQIDIPDRITEEDFSDLEYFDGYNTQKQPGENGMVSDESVRMVGSVVINDISSNYYLLLFSYI